MKTLITLKTITFFILLIISGRVSYAQVKKEGDPTNLTLPDSYYKGQEEKRKYAESHKTSGTPTMTLSTFYPVQQQKEKLNPELKAKSLLNTVNIPAGFPSFNSQTMSEREYESTVAQWFKVNPTYRKSNNK